MSLILAGLAMMEFIPASKALILYSSSTCPDTPTISGWEAPVS